MIIIPSKLLRPSEPLSSLLSTTRHIVISIPLGPLLPPQVELGLGFVEEVGISCKLLAMGMGIGVEDPEMLAIYAASMALAMSSISRQEAVGGCLSNLPGGSWGPLR